MHDCEIISQSYSMHRHIFAGRPTKLKPFRTYDILGARRLWALRFQKTGIQALGTLGDPFGCAALSNDRNRFEARWSEFTIRRRNGCLLFRRHARCGCVAPMTISGRSWFDANIPNVHTRQTYFASARTLRHEIREKRQ